MEFLIPYTKEIDFKGKIKEIISISLEHEMNINEEEILGNFIVSGEYKSHELSVNKEEFSYTLPFSIDISNNLDNKTINFEITDFAYEILNDSVLKVMIESKVSGEEKIEEASVLFEQPEEIIEEEIPLIERNDIEEEIPVEEQKTIERDQMIETKEEVISKEEQVTKEYSTYIIHVVSESDTIDSICEKYKILKSDLEQYNDISKITIKEKLLIPSNE